MNEKQTPHVMVDCTLQSGATVTVPIPHPEATDKPEPKPSLYDIFQSTVGK
jgi:hypothetical protein